MLKPYREHYLVQCSECGWQGDVEELEKRTVLSFKRRELIEDESETVCPKCQSVEVY